MKDLVDRSEELRQAVEGLAWLRKIAADQKAEASRLQGQIAQLPLSQAMALLRENMAMVTTRKSDAEKLVRNLAVDLYCKTDNRKPHPAVPIKMYTVLEYEEYVAFQYIRENLPVALKADWALFEKIAKTVGNKFGFVTERKEPRATIARNLSKWEPAEEKDDAKV